MNWLKKLSLYPLTALAASGVVLADGDFMGYGMMGGMGTFGMGLFGLVYFAIGAFLFSLIFWMTYKLMVEDKTKRKK